MKPSPKISSRTLFAAALACAVAGCQLALDFSREPLQDRETDDAAVDASSEASSDGGAGDGATLGDAGEGDASRDGAPNDASQTD